MSDAQSPQDGLAAVKPHFPENHPLGGPRAGW